VIGRLYSTRREMRNAYTILVENMKEMTVWEDTT
jgi:hypothetical protein